MWDRLKELGFTICAIALGVINLVTFTIIILKDIYQIWEPNELVLGIEAVLCLGFVCWGFERLIKDIKG